MPESSPQYPPLPPDDLQRSLTFAQPDGNETLPHICHQSSESVVF